jgi:hypothetical protein
MKQWASSQRSCPLRSTAGRYQDFEVALRALLGRTVDLVMISALRTEGFRREAVTRHGRWSTMLARSWASLERVRKGTVDELAHRKFLQGLDRY